MSLGVVRRGNLWDGLAIGLSAACLVHCLALPLALALLPASTVWLALPEGLEAWIVIGAAPLSTLVLVTAWRDQHGGGAPALALGLVGLAGMASAITIEASAAEPVVASGGALLLAIAHVLNWRRRARCPT